MKRDLRLVRSILLDLEEGSEFKADDPLLSYHFHLLQNARFVRGGGELSWEGHEVLELLRDESRFEACLQELEQANCPNFSLLLSMLHSRAMRIEGSF